MSTLELYVGKSKYTINCQESEKNKISNLAKKLNQRVNELSVKIRDAEEKTILMLCAIMTEEELETLKSAKITSNKQEESSINDIGSQNDQHIAKILTKNIEDVAIYIEKLANKIQKG